MKKILVSSLVAVSMLATQLSASMAFATPRFDHHNHGNWNDEIRVPYKFTGKDRVMNAAETIHARNVYITNAEGQKVKLDGSGTMIGILDDGIIPEHPGLSRPPAKPKRLDNNGKPVKIFLGRNWADGNADFSSNSPIPYHGLHVAGIAAANGPSSTEPDAPPIYGVAPEAQIAFEKIQDTNTTAIVKDDVMAQAMQAAINNGADVINLSLGTDSATSNTTGISDAIKLAASKGVVVVSTAGNQGYVGNGAVKPLATNPDYGVIARPGMNPLTIDAVSVNNSVFKGHGFKLAGDTSGREIGFNQEKDNSYSGPRANIANIQNDWFNYDDWYDYTSLNGQDIQYVVLDRPNEENIKKANVANKFILIPRKFDGISNKENNPTGKIPDYVLAAQIAKKYKAQGLIVSNDDTANKGLNNFYPELYRGYYDTNKEWHYYYDVWEELIKYPIMAVSNSDGKYLRGATKKTIKFNSSIHEIKYSLANQIADFSSWGVSSDFVFKGDLATPSAKRVMSLGQLREWNSDTRSYDKLGLGVVLNQGTSQSAPQISGAVALIKQRLNEQYPELVKTPSERIVYLIKNLLMSTAVPQYDIFANDQNTYYSPRVQGNGLMDVAAAAKTDVVAVSPNTDDPETGFAKTNLRQINGNTVSFDIELQNYGSKTHTYTPYLYLMTDEVKDQHFTMHSKPLVNGKKLDSVSVQARDTSSQEPKKQTVHIQYTLPREIIKELTKLAPNGFFLDGYVQFVATDDDSVDLYHSFTGFHGDWKKPAVYDTFVYDLKDGEKPFYYTTTPDTNNAGRDGDLNSTHLETMINNGTTRRILGALPDYNKDNMKVSDQHLTISNNGDKNADTINPVFTMLRNYQQILIDVTDAEHNKVFSGEYGLGITDRKKNFYSYNRSDGLITENPKRMSWNGKNTVTEVPLPEGEYDYKVSVIPDYINSYNGSSFGASSNKDLTVTRDFKIKIDNTAPILKETEIVGEEGAYNLVKFKVVDPKLLNTQTDGSGVYTAELITASGTQRLDLDPLHPELFANAVFKIKKSEFNDARLKLTDWGYNSQEYRPALTLKGLETGYLQIKSVDKEGNGVSAGYTLRNVKTGKEYVPESNIPVGIYQVIPLNVPAGYRLLDSPKKLIVKIEKEKTSQIKITYQGDIHSVSLTVSNDNEKQVNYVRDHNIKLRLTDKDTGAVFIADLSKYGSYGMNLNEGTYKVDFLDAEVKDNPLVWDSSNHPIKYIVIDDRDEYPSYLFTIKGSKPGKAKTILPKVDTYISDQTYMTMTGNQGYTPSIKVYAHDDLQLHKPLFIIGASNGTREVRELKSKLGFEESTYYFDLTDEQIGMLKPGMILKPVITKGNISLENDRVAVVGYNHTLMDQKLEYLKQYINNPNNSFSQKVKDSTNKKVDGLLYTYSDPKNSTGFDIRIRDYLINRNGADASAGSYSNPSLEDVVNMLVIAQNKIDNDLGAIYAELGITEKDIPIIYLHKGSFPNVRTLLYPTDHDGYSAKEVPTTAIINDLKLVKNAVKKHIYSGFVKDKYGRPLVPDHLDRIKLLPILDGYLSGKQWKRIDTGSKQNIISKAGVYHLDSQKDRASYDLGVQSVATLTVHTVEKDTNNNLASQELTLTPTAGNPIKVKTDISGLAEISDLAPGGYTLTRKAVNSADKDELSWQVKVDENGQLFVDGNMLKPIDQFDVLYPKNENASESGEASGGSPVNPGGTADTQPKILLVEKNSGIQLSETVVGHDMKVIVHGYKPGERVDFTFHSQVVKLGSAIADNNGTAALQFKIPNVSLGEHVVKATGAESGISLTAKIRVIAPKGLLNATPLGINADLANTGLPIDYAIFVVCLLSIVTGVVAIRRKRIMNKLI